MRPIPRHVVAIPDVVIAIAVIAVVSLASAAVPPLSGGASPPLPDPAGFACSLPHLPHGTIHPRSSRSASPALSGPAVAALTGGAARRGFSLDHGGLTIEPPERSMRPRLTEHQALCAAMASGMSGGVATGVAAGYALVSVQATLLPAFTLGAPRAVPTVRSFHHRLAWLVVERHEQVVFCPAETLPVHPAAPLPSYHAYQVFIIDATTGQDGLIYDEGGGPPPCGFGGLTKPSVSDATERLSVPWTLSSRDPDGYSGTIQAMIPPCATYTDVVLVTQGTNDLGVFVTLPVGACCGPPEPVTLTLHAAVVTADLPTEIAHDPVGLVTGGPAPAPSVSPTTPSAASPPATTAPTTTTAPALITVGPSDNGQTIQMAVGQVLTVPPLPGAHGLTTTTNPVTSNNPSVLGPLSSGPQPLVAELRAWEPGTATLTVPEDACKHPGSDQVPCDGPFAVNVVVRPPGDP